MLRKGPTQPSFLPRSASRIPGGLGVWVSSERAGTWARSPGLHRCSPMEPGGLLCPPGTTRDPLDLFSPQTFHPFFSEFLCSPVNGTWVGAWKRGPGLTWGSVGVQRGDPGEAAGRVGWGGGRAEPQQSCTCLHNFSKSSRGMLPPHSP